jgi:starch-binding outer membrane protein, SusD/RagB family
MRRQFVLWTLAATVSGCNETVVPNFNAPTNLPHTVAALQNEVTGAFDAGRTDVGRFELFEDAFGRNSAYFTSSEQRWVLVGTGSVEVNEGDTFVGPIVWDFYYNGIKGIDTIIASVPNLQVSTSSGLAPFPAPQQEAMFGAMETLKALYYMYIIETRDTLGLPMNGVGQATPAPILCNRDAWAQIVSMLDSASDSLVKAGPATTFPIIMPPGFSLVSGSAGTFEGFTLALRGKARLYYAYTTGRPTDTLTVGSPNTAQLDSAISDIQAATPIYSASLTAAEAVAPNDLGVFHTFSTSSNDVTNPINFNAQATYVLWDALNDIDTLDNRFVAKYADAGPSGGPTSPGAPIGSDWHYVNNMSGSEPLPIVRNVELQLLLAEAEISRQQYAPAIAILRQLRTVVGGLADTTVNADYVSARNFFLKEQRVSLLTDGEGDRVFTLRDWNLVVARDTTWSATGFGHDTAAIHQRAGVTDYHTSVVPIPLGEQTARGGNITPVCP